MRRRAEAIGGREVLAGIGLTMIGGGLAMVSIPIALVTTGALLLALAVLPVIARGDRE